MNGKRFLILIPVLTAVLFSILAIAYVGFERVEFGDAQDYINAARAILDGTPYPRQSIFHPMFRPPLFPIFITLIWTIFPDSVIAVKMFQAILHGATVLVIYKTVYEIIRKESAAFFGAIVCAVNPLLAAHTVDFYTEPLHTFLCASAMLTLVKVLKEGESFYWKVFGAGVVFGLATLCRPAILGVAVCLAMAIGLLRLKENRSVKSLAASVIMLAGIFAAIVPWTVYNYQTTGEIILVNDGFSYNLWLGNLPETLKLYEGEFKSKEENEQFADYVWGKVQTEKLKELEQTDNYSSLKLNEREKVWRREAIKEMSADYGLTARLMVGKLWAFWTPFLNKFTYGWKIVTLVALFVISTYVFGIYGMYIFAKEKVGKKYVILLLISFAATTAIHVLIFGFVRYRVPNVDPYLSMLSGVALWHIALKLFPNYKFLQN